MQIAQLLTSTNYQINDFQFMLDIAKLVVVARRSLSYTYAIRFNLRGVQKQFFFDFIQADMERSLENLNKRMEEYWLENLDIDARGRMQMGQRFIKYKESVTSLRVTVEKHFNTLMWEIMNGLPSIACNDESTAEDYSFDGSNVGQEWSCTVCLSKN